MRCVKFILIGVLGFTLFAQVLSAEEVFTLLSFPTYSFKGALDKYGALSKYLLRETGIKIKPELVVKQENFESGLYETDFSVHDSFSFWVNKQRGIELDPLAIEVNIDGVPEQACAILVKSDSDIWTVDELHNRTFLFGPSHSNMYYSAFLTLAEAGIGIDSGLKSYGFGKSCVESAMKVFVGDYDACVVSMDFYEKTGREKFNFKTDLRPIGKTRPVPYRIVAASKKTDREIVEKVKNALLRLKPGSPLLDGMHTYGFVKYTGSALEQIEKNVEEYGIIIKH